MFGRAPSWHQQLNVRVLDLQEYLVLREDHKPAIDLGVTNKWVNIMVINRIGLVGL